MYYLDDSISRRPAKYHEGPWWPDNGRSMKNLVPLMQYSLEMHETRLHLKQAGDTSRVRLSQEMPCYVRTPGNVTRRCIWYSRAPPLYLSIDE